MKIVIAALITAADGQYHANANCDLIKGRRADGHNFGVRVTSEQLARVQHMPCTRCWRDEGYVVPPEKAEKAGKGATA